MMAALTVPFALMDFAWLVQWSGLLGVMSQVIQGIIFVLLRIPSYMEKMARKDDTTLEAWHGLGSEFTSIAQVVNDAKFIIGGGWPVACLVLLGLFGSSGLLCYASGWMSLVVSVGLVIGMFVLKGLEIAIVWAIRKCGARPEQGSRDDRLTTSLVH
jgi:hypothetical protein